MDLRRATPADEAQILDLAQRTLGWGPEPRWAELFRWKHDDNPCGPSPRWVAVDEGRVVGFRVFLRWRFTDQAGRRLHAVRAVDTATDPDHQGRGIFKRLTTAAIAELVDEGVDFVFNTPNDQSRPGYLKMGWVVVGRPSIATVPTGVRGLVRQTRARTAASLWSEPSTTGLSAIDVLGTESAATLAGSLGATDHLTTERSIDFLRWRYGLERLNYRAVRLGADAADGIAIYRERRRGAALEATVTEVLVPDVADAGRRRRRLLREVRRTTAGDYLLVGTDRSLLGAPALPCRRSARSSPGGRSPAPRHRR